MSTEIIDYMIAGNKVKFSSKSDHQHLVILDGEHSNEMCIYLDSLSQVKYLNKKLALFSFSDIKERSIQNYEAITDCEIIPLYDDKGFPYLFHIKDCTVEIFDSTQNRTTHIIITNKDSEKRKSALRELEQVFE